MQFSINRNDRDAFMNQQLNRKHFLEELKDFFANKKKCVKTFKKSEE